MNRWSLMGKLGALGQDTTTTAADMPAVVVPEDRVNGPEDLLDWDAIDWRTEREKVRRLRQRIFKATQAACRACPPTRAA
jgi:RNA-directed DNA polymerase